MSEERNKLLEELRLAARDLASYASYAEIVGAIGHNRSEIKKNCDLVYEVDAKIKHIDENKRFKVVKRKDAVPPINQDGTPSDCLKDVEGNTYQFMFAWDEEGEPEGVTAWYPNDDTYPSTGPEWIVSLDLVEVTGD